MTFHIALVVISAILLFWASNKIVEGITTVARYLRWLEFVIAFFVMAIASSIPNLFVGISSAIYNIPELSFGDVVGNSVVDLTLVVALAVLLGKEIFANHPLIQKSSFLTIVIAIVPLLLLLDGELGRGDGFILLTIFFLYSSWLLSKRHTYEDVFNNIQPSPPVVQFQAFLAGIVKVAIGVVAMLISAQGIVQAASFFAETFNIPVAMIGIFVLGLGSAVPEAYFATIAARKGKDFIILGQLLGAVIVLATLVLGVVALINPIEIQDFSPFQIARFFLIISAIFFLIFARTDRKITKKEAGFLLFLYLAFIVAEALCVRCLF